MEQTNRTILFEELNPDKENLFTILETAKEQESLTDEEICEIEEQFVVRNFDELLEKFQPTIYFTMGTADNEYSFSYENTNTGALHSIPIFLNSENRLLTLFTGMLDYKVTGKIPTQKLAKLADYIFPQRDFEELIRLRRAVKTAYVEKNLFEAERLLYEKHELLSNPLLQMQFYIKEAQTLLNEKQLQEGFIRLEETPEMQIKILCRSAKFDKAEPSLSGEETAGFCEWLNTYLSDRKLCVSEVVRQNILSAVCLVKEDLTQYLLTYKQVLRVYGGIVRDYWKVAQPMFQTLLGIRSFFAQYGDRQGSMQPSLLVTNCTPKQMMDVRRLKYFETFLETVNQKNTHVYTIWYAILPRIENAIVTNRKNLRERFSGNGERDFKQVNEIDTTKTLMNMLAKYKVQMFLSTATAEENTFVAFAKEGMEGVYENFHPFEKENYTTYLIPCYPNFRLMLKEQAKVSIGMQLEQDDFLEDVFRSTSVKNVWLTGLYIDAAYVGAGLVAAYQCTDYLNGFYQKSVDTELPGVAYRILEGDNRHRTKTVMAKEICGYNEELTKQIMKNGSGIIFASEKSGVTVLSDKTMALHNGNKISISQIQTMTYLERVIRAMTQDYKDTLIKKFFVNRQDNIMHKWMKNRTMINSLFRDGETIQYQINEQEGTCNFEVRFTDSVIESQVRLSR